MQPDAAPRAKLGRFFCFLTTSFVVCFFFTAVRSLLLSMCCHAWLTSSHLIAVKSMSVSVTVNGASTLSGSTRSSTLPVLFKLFTLHEFRGRIAFWKRCQTEAKDKRKPSTTNRSISFSSVTHLNRYGGELYRQCDNVRGVTWPAVT